MIKKGYKEWKVLICINFIEQETENNELILLQLLQVEGCGL